MIRLVPSQWLPAHEKRRPVQGGVFNAGGSSYQSGMT